MLSQRLLNDKGNTNYELLTSKIESQNISGIYHRIPIIVTM